MSQTIVKRRARIGDVYSFGVISELRPGGLEYICESGPYKPERSVCGSKAIHMAVYHGEFSDLIAGLRWLHGARVLEIDNLIRELRGANA